jgi:hypothetical protein
VTAVFVRLIIEWLEEEVKKGKVHVKKIQELQVKNRGERSVLLLN